MYLKSITTPHFLPIISISNPYLPAYYYTSTILLISLDNRQNHVYKNTPHQLNNLLVSHHHNQKMD